MTVQFGDVACQLDAAATPGAVQAVWQETVRALGFFTFDYAFGKLKTPAPRSVADFQPACYLSALDWSGFYFERGYQDVDPFTIRSLTQRLPWAYDEVFRAEPTSRKQRELIGDLQAAHIRQGLAIPMHGHSETAVMHFGSDLSAHEFAALDREIRPLAALLAAYFHERMGPLVAPLKPKPVVTLTDNAERVAARRPPIVRSGAGRGKSLLSPRERECLLWVALGKTSWEISVILRVSEATVNNILAAARRKLGVATRSQAVARALALGLIEF